jgi:squalene-hopene/tetraprenyl-beta-curcumene cyclase
MADEADTLGPPPARFQKVVGKGIDYLLAQGQAADGSFSSQAGPGVTALATTAILAHGRKPDDPKIAKALKYLEGFIQKDGGIYKEGSTHRNYETSLAVVCFSRANQDHRYNDTLKRADAFLKGLVWDEDDEKDKSDFEYGGAGYGGHKRPDLSNTSFLIDALKATGNGPDDPAMQKALIFISRCQNLESEHNKTPFSAKNPDGGFYYTPASGGVSQAGETPDGGLRSYGSMTYSGLKSMIHAGVGPDDPRVKAAVEWIRKFYDVKANPGMGQTGVYYYYHLFAKALSATGMDRLEDADGVKHDWRKELVAELDRRQEENGSWINEETRWLEGDPNLATSYSLMGLSYCRPVEAADSK